MNNNYSIIGKLLLVIPFLTCIMINHPASAQEKENHKIPVEIIEEKIPAQPGKHRMALGVNVDPFPTIISAFGREFGLSIQPWFGFDHFKLRIDIAHLRMPDSIAGTRYFYKNNINSFSLMAEYIFGDNFDGFFIGSGFGIWQNTISHKYLNGKGSCTMPLFTLEGGYIWKFYKNLYLEPCLALDIMLTRQTISIYRFTYKPLSIAGEITIKFGLYVDI